MTVIILFMSGSFLGILIIRFDLIKMVLAFRVSNTRRSEDDVY